MADLLTGTAELTVAGALGGRKAAAKESDRTLTGIAARTSAVTGLGSGLSALLCGLTVVCAAAVGASAVAGGRLRPGSPWPWSY